ncbi:hypothetical protein BJ165DRAFT_1464118 [Panaeolus papilionaceus]|nr:hypothetical protein BJ165DRAFT_1464118 [Panaeolus papilionaceus]
MGFRRCDIGYATPFEWVWEQVLKEFPNAIMDFDNLYKLPFGSPLWLSRSCCENHSPHWQDKWSGFK